MARTPARLATSIAASARPTSASPRAREVSGRASGGTGRPTRLSIVCSGATGMTPSCRSTASAHSTRRASSPPKSATLTALKTRESSRSWGSSCSTGSWATEETFSGSPVSLRSRHREEARATRSPVNYPAPTLHSRLRTAVRAPGVLLWNTSKSFTIGSDFIPASATEHPTKSEPSTSRITHSPRESREYRCPLRAHQTSAPSSLSPSS